MENYILDCHKQATAEHCASNWNYGQKVIAWVTKKSSNMLLLKYLYGILLDMSIRGPGDRQPKALEAQPFQAHFRVVLRKM